MAKLSPNVTFISTDYRSTDATGVAMCVQSYGNAPHFSENNSAVPNLSHRLWLLLSCHYDHFLRHFHHLALARFW